MKSTWYWLTQRLPEQLASVGRFVVLLAALILAALLDVMRRTGAIITALRSWWRALSPRGRRRSLTIAVMIATLAALWPFRHPAGHWFEATFTNQRPLLAAKSWFYHLSNLDMEKIAASTADLVVIDYAKIDGNVPLTPAEVARAKRKPDGTPRLAVAYFSIGEAEGYRFYWQKDWVGQNMPAWHVAENCAWPRNHMVRYWHDGWKDIVYRGEKSYLKRIVDAGFDGVYLDRIDVFWEQIKDRPTAREDMITFVTELAETGRRLKPGFLVIAQNAEDLLLERRYRDIIDGLGKEDLLYGAHGTGVRNPAPEIASALEGIKALQADWKPVFAVEYLPSQPLMEHVRKELAGLGMVPTFAHRSLDGGDPLAVRPPATMPYGTAEWIKEQCEGKPHW